MELHNKAPDNSPKSFIEIANDSVYETHLRMLLKMDFKVQMDTKSWQLKNESKSEVFSAPGMQRRVQKDQR